MVRPIRDDLDLHCASATATGQPVWTIHDPVRNKFFQIEWQVFEVLSRWDRGSADRIARDVNIETTLEISTEFVKQVEGFLYTHQLCRIDDIKAAHFLGKRREQGIKAWGLWLLHHYLFFRVPLFKPDKFLKKTLPYVRFLYSRTMGWVVFSSLVMGLILVLHQWDTFIDQFVDMFTFRGLAFFGMRLFL